MYPILHSKSSTMKKIIFILTPVLFLFAFNTKSQSQSVDSLILLADTTKNPERKIAYLLQICNNFNEGSFEKAEFYGNKALNLSIENDYPYGIRYAHWLLGFSYYYRADYHSALNHFLKKLNIDKANNDTIGMASTYNLMGNIYYFVKDYNKAESLYFQALQFYEATNDSHGLSDIYTNLGNINEAKQAKALAEEYYHKGLNMDRQTHDTTGIIITLNNLGNLYYKQYNDTSASQYFHEALNLLNKRIAPDTQALLFINYADFLLWQKKTAKAKPYIDKAQNIAEQNHLPFYLSMSAKSNMEYYRQTENYEKAFAYQTMGYRLQDSIMNNDVTNRITLLQLQHEQAQEEQTQKLLLLNKERKLRTQQWLAFSLFLIAIFSTILILSYHRSRRKQNLLKEAKWKSEKKRLNEQLSFRNKEITLKVMALMERNELIKEVISRLQKSVLKMKKSNQQEVEDIIKELNTNCTENITKEFEYRFQQVHTNFYKNLTEKYTTLTPNDLKLSAFLRLNMSTKDIAAITHQSINAIEVGRTRLRKKLQIQQTDTDLVNFLSHF